MGRQQILNMIIILSCTMDLTSSGKLYFLNKNSLKFILKARLYIKRDSYCGFEHEVGKQSMKFHKKIIKNERV